MIYNIDTGIITSQKENKRPVLKLIFGTVFKNKKTKQRD